MKFIVSADWHMRMNPPRCRRDPDWENTMRKMLRFMARLRKKVNGELLIIGDLFDASQQPAWVVNMFLSEIDSAIIYAGNHDFKHRNLEEIENSSIGHVLKNPKYIPRIPEEEGGFIRITENILLCHRLVYAPKDSGLAKFKNGISAETLVEMALEENPDVKWVLIGDNHHKFIYEDPSGVIVVNPGSPMIFNASMIDEECGVYILDNVTGELKFEPVPDSSDLVTDKYLREEEALTDSIQEAMVSLNEENTGSLDFFDINDEKSRGQSNLFISMYEEIKTTAIEMKTKTRKGN